MWNDDLVRMIHDPGVKHGGVYEIDVGNIGFEDLGRIRHGAGWLYRIRAT